jgi:CCR4-NOT transcription complex subunit 3
MAANRKLVQLVESTLRKVDEGLFEFNEMWMKVEECSNPNQRVRGDSNNLILAFRRNI